MCKLKLMELVVRPYKARSKDNVIVLENEYFGSRRRIEFLRKRKKGLSARLLPGREIAKSVPSLPFYPVA